MSLQVRVIGRRQVRQLGRTFRRFVPYVLPHWRRLSLALACTFGFIVMGLMAPWPIQMVIDGVLLGNRNEGMLVWLGPWLPTSTDDLLLVCSVAVVAIAALKGFFFYKQRILAVVEQVKADLEVKANREIGDFYRNFNENPELRIYLDGIDSLRRGLATRTTLILHPTIWPWSLTQPEVREMFRPGADGGALDSVPTRQKAAGAQDGEAPDGDGR